MFYFAEKVFLKGFPGSHYIMNLESSVYGCQHIQPRTIVHLFWITFICSLKFLEPVILISSLSLECNLFVYCGTSIVTFSASELKVVLWYFNRIKTIFFFFSVLVVIGLFQQCLLFSYVQIWELWDLLFKNKGKIYSSLMKKRCYIFHWLWIYIYKFIL